MSLADWRARWIMVALTACTSSQSWMHQRPATKVSVFDAPPLDRAKYVALVRGPEGRREHHPAIAAEHGAHTCGRALELALADPRDREAIDPAVKSAAATSCPEPITAMLRENLAGRPLPHPILLIVDGDDSGRWLMPADALAAAGAFDTPAKAMLAVWLTPGYDLNFVDANRQVAGLESGRARRVAGGHEVAAVKTVERPDKEHQRRMTLYLVTLFVDEKGAVRERGSEVLSSWTADRRHPHGRRPSDFVDVDDGETVLDHLRRAMHHEAESVRAFERIARELRHHGAPAELVAAARAAADDERDHAARCARLTGDVLAIATDELPVRPLVELAIDNVREGCVGEAFAALIATAQATRAATAELRAHFAAIAADEVAHAALASAIAAWIEPRLSADERAQVDAARDTSLAAMRAPAGPAELGLPTYEHAAALLATVAAMG